MKGLSIKIMEKRTKILNQLNEKITKEYITDEELINFILKNKEKDKKVI